MTSLKPSASSQPVSRPRQLWRRLTLTAFALLAGMVIGTGTASAADTVAPSSAITAPAAGQVVSGTTAVTATATDDTAVTKVELWMDTTLVATDTTTPYSFSWNTTTASNGSHSLTTKAYDAANNIGTSSVIPVTVQQPASCTNTPDPSLGQSTQSVTVPSTGTYKVWSRIMVADTTNNSYYLQIDSNCAVNVGDSSSVPANTWTWVDYQAGNTATKTTVSLTAGSHTITMIGRETDVKVDVVLLLTDQACTPTGTGTNCATADTTAPTAPTGLSVTQPDSTHANLSWTASTDSAGVVGYNIMRNGTKIATTLGTTYSDTSVVAGTTYTYTVTAYDASGNISPASNSAVINAKPADLNNDGSVNVFDLSILLSNWAKTGSPTGDINHDGTVNVFDLSILLSAWGT